MTAIGCFVVAALHRKTCRENPQDAAPGTQCLPQSSETLLLLRGVSRPWIWVESLLSRMVSTRLQAFWEWKIEDDTGFRVVSLKASDFGCSWQYCFKAIQHNPTNISWWHFVGWNSHQRTGFWDIRQIFLDSFPCRQACHSWSHAKGGGSFDVPLLMDQNWLISWSQNSKHCNSRDANSLGRYPDTPPCHRIVSTNLNGLNNWCVGKISD